MTITSSVQGVLIPPSQNMIYYALAAGGLPIGQLTLAGYVLGFLLMASLMLLCAVIAIRNDHPRGKTYGLKDGLKTAGQATIGLFTIVIIIGGIVVGIFSATESAAVAVAYAPLVTVFVYRSLDRAGIMRVMSGTLRSLGMGLCTPPVGTSLIVGCAIARTRIERTVKSVLPFYLAMLVTLLLVTCVPALSLTLPRWLG